MAIKCSKALMIAFFLYIFWYKEAIQDIKIVLFGTVILAVLFSFFDMISNRFVRPNNKFVNMLFVFGAYCFVTGVFVSYDFDLFISLMIRYAAFLVVCLNCWYISYRQKNMKWILDSLVLVATVCSIYTIFWGYDYQTEVVVRTMGPENNPHTLGFIMIMGVFSIIAREGRTKNHFYASILLLALFTSVIFISGSRKSLFCVAFLLIIWLVAFLKKAKKTTFKKIQTKKGFLVAILLVVFIGASFFALYKYVGSDAIDRLLLLFEEDGALKTRWNLYITAFELWKTKPLFGIGFNQYQALSGYGYYSHSTYAELISCTGIIGTLVFMLPIVLFLISLSKKVLKKGENKYDYTMCLAMLLTELILGLVQIYFYDVGHMLILTILFAEFDRLNSKNGEVLK